MRTIRKTLVLILLCAAMLAALFPTVVAAVQTTDIIFVVDCSGSMKSADPNSCAAEFYRYALENVNRETTGVGLVCFSNYLEYSSESIHPLTLDEDFSAAMKEAEQIIRTNLDTDIALALREADKLISGGSAEEKIVILICDGVTDLPNGPRTEAESAAELETLTERFVENGVRVCSVGINKNGNVDTTTMDALAGATQGLVRIVTNADDVPAAARDILSDFAGVAEEQSCRFAEIYGDLLQSYMEFETNGELQMIKNSFSTVAATPTAPNEEETAISDAALQAVEQAKKEKGGILEALFDKLGTVSTRIQGMRDAANEAIEGDLSALDELTSGADAAIASDGFDSELSGAEEAPTPTRQDTVPAGDYYMVLRSESSLSRLKLYPAEDSSGAVTDFYDFHDGYYAVSLAPFANNGSIGELLLELKGEAGKKVEVSLLNLDEIGLVMGMETGYMKPNEPEKVSVYLERKGAPDAVRGACAKVELSLDDGTGKPVPASMSFADGIFGAEVIWPDEAILTLRATATIPDGGLPFEKTLELRCCVSENPLHLINEKPKFVILLSSFGGKGNVGKSFRYGELISTNRDSSITVEAVPATDVRVENDPEAQTVKLMPAVSGIALRSFFLEFSDGLYTVSQPVIVLSLPLLAAAFGGILILGIAGLIGIAFYRKKHTKFVGKLYLKFILPEGLREASIEMSELIFPYVSSISLWELVLLNSSMYDAMMPVLKCTDFERVARSVRIDSRQKDQIWLILRDSRGDIAVDGKAVGKHTTVVMLPDTRALLSFSDPAGTVQVSLSRDPNSMDGNIRTYETHRSRAPMDQKTENARRRMSEVSSAVPETVRAMSEEDLAGSALSEEERVRYYVFATILGMLKQDQENRTIRLYRDAADFSPVTLINTGLIDNNIYYHVFRVFSTKLDRVRRETLDGQIRELLTVCAGDQERSIRTEKQVRSMILNYKTMQRSAETEGMANPEETEQNLLVAAFYGSVVDVCKQVLSKIANEGE